MWRGNHTLYKTFTSFLLLCWAAIRYKHKEITFTLLLVRAVSFTPLLQVWPDSGASHVWSKPELKCGSADITIPLSSPSSSSLSYLSSTVLSSSHLISLSISSLFTAYSVWGLPTLTALQSFIKPLINSRHAHLHTDTRAFRGEFMARMCVCVLLAQDGHVCVEKNEHRYIMHATWVSMHCLRVDMCTCVFMCIHLCVCPCTCVYVISSVPVCSPRASLFSVHNKAFYWGSNQD